MSPKAIPVPRGVDLSTLEGVYEIDAEDDRYFVALALIAENSARFLGERFDARGVKHVVFSTGGAFANAPEQREMRVDANFYSSVLKDYEDWQEKWFREVIQNAVDAGAKHVDLKVEARLRPGTTEADFVVSCRDDGRGMDQETLLNKFLVLGGSTKSFGDKGLSLGGFGKAKELIALPWISWKIHTRDNIAEGQGVKYSFDTAPRIDGTLVEVVMPKDKATTAYKATSFLSKCYLPDVKFTVDGKEKAADLKPHEQIDRFGDKGIVYHNPADVMSSSQILVRVGGLYHFGVYVTSSVRGVFILELTGRSIDLLSANRDGFRDQQLRWDVSNFVNELAADIFSKIRKGKGETREVYQGRGKFVSDESALRSAMLNQVKFKRKVGHVEDEDIENVADALDKMGGAQQDERLLETSDPRSDQAIPRAVAPPMNMRPTGDLARIVLKVDMRGPSQVEAALKQLAWEPDFIIINSNPDKYEAERQTEFFKVTDKFRPETMAPNMRKLARLWAELCRFVLIQLGSERDFGVGWIFVEGVRAATVREEGKNWMMLNPFKGGAVGRKKLWSASSVEDVDFLFAAAVHECTHLHNSVSAHDEAFAAALTDSMVLTAGGQRIARQIRRVVVSRIFAPGAVTGEAFKDVPRAPVGPADLPGRVDIRLTRFTPTWIQLSEIRATPGGMLFLIDSRQGQWHEFDVVGVPVTIRAMFLQILSEGNQVARSWTEAYEWATSHFGANAEYGEPSEEDEEWEIHNIAWEKIR